jgi:hypothetical protein
MKISEYEEGFQRPVPSWRQILTVNQKLNRTPRSKRRYVLVAALIALMTLTMEIASHRAAHSDAGGGSAIERAFDVLPADFQRILDLVRNGTGGRPCETVRSKEPLAEADH